MPASLLTRTGSRTIVARWLDSFRNRGFIGTVWRAVSVLEERLFDWRYGTDTVAFVKIVPETICSPNAFDGLDYMPTRIRPLRKVLVALNDDRDGVLVDYGCGKGRVLLVAAECGFSRCVGIEFMPELCKVARLNVARYQRKTGSKTDIQIIQTDAAEYDVLADQTHFYFFNPFEARVLRSVLERIKQSLQRNPRRAYVIYNTPKHGQVVEAVGFRPMMQFEGNEIVIYSNFPH